MKYYSLKQVEQNQRFIQKKGQRSLFGESRHITTPNGSMEALCYLDKAKSTDYVVVEVHGGGFMYNTARDDDDFCAYIHNRLKLPVIACDYHCAPQFKYPAGMQDISACIQHVRREWGLSEKHIIIWGHSAGANLTSGAAFWDKEEKVFSIGLQILDYPYMDTYLKANERKRICQSVSGKLMDTFAHYYTEEENVRNPLVSPVLSETALLRQMPETYLLLCGKDNLNEGGKRYGQLLKNAGVKVEVCYEKEALHGFIENHFNYEQIPFTTKIQNTHTQRDLAVYHTDKICSWIQSKISTAASS